MLYLLNSYLSVRYYETLAATACIRPLRSSRSPHHSAIDQQVPLVLLVKGD